MYRPDATERPKGFQLGKLPWYLRLQLRVGFGRVRDSPGREEPASLLAACPGGERAGRPSRRYSAIWSCTNGSGSIEGAFTGDLIVWGSRHASTVATLCTQEMVQRGAQSLRLM